RACSAGVLRTGQGAAAPRRQSLPLVAPFRGDPPHDGPIGDGPLVDVVALVAATCIRTASRFVREPSCLDLNPPLPTLTHECSGPPRGTGRRRPLMRGPACRS